MKYIVGFLMAVLLSISFTSCSFQSAREKEAVVSAFRDIKEMSDSSIKYGVPAEHVMKTINDTAKIVVEKIDPEHEYGPTKKALEIYYGWMIVKETDQPNPALEEIQIKTKERVESIVPINWGMIAGTSLVAAGFIGKFFGGPFNIAGILAQFLGRRLIPEHNEIKKAAVGAIASIDSVVVEFDNILSQHPELRNELKEKLGKEPILWMRERLKSTQIDMGIPEVKNVLTSMRKELTTVGGVLKPTPDEIENFVRKLG